MSLDGLQSTARLVQDAQQDFGFLFLKQRPTGLHVKPYLNWKHFHKEMAIWQSWDLLLKKKKQEKKSHWGCLSSRIAGILVPLVVFKIGVWWYAREQDQKGSTTNNSRGLA